MTAITLHLTNLKDIKQFEKLAKKLNVTIEKKEEVSPYDPEFVAKILKSEEDMKNGLGRKIAIKDLWK